MLNDEEYKFDTWAQLARKSPDIFEKRRREFLEAYISRLSTDSKQRLIKLQWRIDAERRRLSSQNKDPYYISYKLYELMWDSFAGENGLNNCLHSTNDNFKQKKPVANVIAIHRNNRDL